MLLRPASPADFEFARRLYYQTMRWAIERLFGWDEAAENAKFERQFVLPEVRIILHDGQDIGWLQSEEEPDALFLKQLYIAGPFQRRGIGTRVMTCLFEEAERAGKPVRLAVVTINPAIAFYEKLGFRVTQRDDHKFFMQRDQPDRSG